MELLTQSDRERLLASGRLRQQMEGTDATPDFFPS
jgi:hypothetical protein